MHFIRIKIFKYAESEKTANKVLKRHPVWPKFHFFKVKKYIYFYKKYLINFQVFSGGALRIALSAENFQKVCFYAKNLFLKSGVTTISRKTQFFRVDFSLQN